MSCLNDLELMLVNHETALKHYKNEYNKVLMAFAPKGYKSSTSYIDADCIRGTAKPDLVEVSDDLTELTEKIAYEEKRIAELKIDIDKIKNNINGLTGLEAKIHEMRYVQGKSLKEISSELGYAYQTIKNLVWEKNKDSKSAV